MFRFEGLEDALETHKRALREKVSGWLCPGRVFVETKCVKHAELVKYC